MRSLLVLCFKYMYVIVFIQQSFSYSNKKVFMFSFVSVYSASLAISAMISTVIIVYVWQRRHVPGGTAFSLVMLATAIWSWTGFMEFMSVDPGTKIFWSKLSYLGVVNIAPLWFVFALRYTLAINSLHR